MTHRQRMIKRFQNLLRFSGLFNIILASPLIIPGVSVWYLIQFSDLNQLLGLGGQAIAVPNDPIHAWMINTAGIGLVLIGTMVLYASARPLARRGIVLLNAVGRLTFCLIVVYYVLYAEMAQITLVLGILDGLIGIGFLYFLVMFRENHDEEPAQSPVSFPIP